MPDSITEVIITIYIAVSQQYLYNKPEMHQLPVIANIIQSNTNQCLLRETSDSTQAHKHTHTLIQIILNNSYTFSIISTLW